MVREVLMREDRLNREQAEWQREKRCGCGALAEEFTQLLRAGLPPGPGRAGRVEKTRATHNQCKRPTQCLSVVA